MRAFDICAWTIVALVTTASCKRDVLQKTVYNVKYEVTPVALYATNADKTKQKSSLQYISILYTDLFNGSIPANKLNKLTEVTLAIGDKTVASDLVLQKLLNESNAQVPTAETMHSNVTQFVSDTYLRFFMRHPTPYESYQLKKIIDDDPAMTPEMVYAAFALSNEYYYY